MRPAQLLTQYLLFTVCAENRYDLRSKRSRSLRTVLFKDSSEDYTFVNPRWLLGIFGDICPTVDTLFQNAKVEQSLTTVVIGKSVRHRHQIIRTGRVENLRSARYGQSAVSLRDNCG